MNVFIGFLIGVSILFGVILFSSLEPVTIHPFSQEIGSNSGTYTLSGPVISIKNYSAISFIEISHCQLVEVIVFDDISDFSDKSVRIVASVQKRNGEKQLVAQSITAHSPRVHSHNPN